MMRSESRTDDTSGLVTMTAASAKRMASVAPRSMPAGLSQITQSNLPRSSLMTLATPDLGQRILVAGLRGRQQPQGLDALVADERLRELRHALHHVDQVEHHSALGAHHQIEVTQADVEIDHGDLLAGLREGGAERGGGGRLADATLAGRHHQHVGHVCHFLSLSIRDRQHAVFKPALHRRIAFGCCDRTAFAPVTADVGERSILTSRLIRLGLAWVNEGLTRRDSGRSLLSPRTLSDAPSAEASAPDVMVTKRAIASGRYMFLRRPNSLSGHRRAPEPMHSICRSPFFREVQEPEPRCVHLPSETEIDRGRSPCRLRRSIDSEPLNASNS